MAAPYPANDPLLSGGFAPIRSEIDCADLVIDGDLPDLTGTLYRIGPNPQYAPRGRYNPLQGDGMVHAFHFENGRVAYRNRWVRTRQWTLERAAGRALFATSGDPRDADASVARVTTDGVANTHVVPYADRLLALEEGHAPIELDPATLETRGPFTFDGRLPRNMSAHPKRDPATGELLFFANFPTRKFDGALGFYIADARGALVRAESIAGPYSALVHDFAITRRFAIFVVCPVTLSLDRLRSGRPPIAWEPARATHIGVVPRDGSTAQTRWYTTGACMVWHTVNAYEDGDRIVLDVCKQQAPAFADVDGRQPETPNLRQYLTRWHIDPEANRIDAQRLSGVVCEYPRIDERRAGLDYRFAYFAAIGGPGTGDPFHRALARFDHVTGAMQTYHAGARRAVSEPVFVARRGATDEGDGYLLATIYDEARNASHLAVLDARDVVAGPIARAYLDHRVPMGFHGSWREAAHV